MFLEAEDGGGIGGVGRKIRIGRLIGFGWRIRVDGRVLEPLGLGVVGALYAAADIPRALSTARLQQLIFREAWYFNLDIYPIQK